jgi:pterin-4a-carbinolamine dehydratase
MARQRKPSNFRFTMKNSNKISEIAKSADFAHPVLASKTGWVKIIFVENF